MTVPVGTGFGKGIYGLSGLPTGIQQTVAKSNEGPTQSGAQGWGEEIKLKSILKNNERVYG